MQNVKKVERTSSEQCQNIQNLLFHNSNFFLKKTDTDESILFTKIYLNNNTNLTEK